MRTKGVKDQIVYIWVRDNDQMTQEKVYVKLPNRFQYPPIVDKKNTTNRERKKKIMPVISAA